MTRFKAPLEYRRTTEGASASDVSRFAGMPVGIQALSDWHVQRINFQVVAELPVTTVSWTITETGVATQALSADLFPPHVILTEAAADNDSTELQWTAGDASGEWISLATDRPCYFETMVRFRDANNNAATVEELDWFVGLAVTDTTVLDGCADYIGFSKVDVDSDTTNRIAFVCGDAGGAAAILRDGLVQATGWTSNNPTGTAATDRGTRTLGANQWIKLAFLIEPEGSGARGFSYCWVNDEPIPGNPINCAGQIPDTEICVTVAHQNGEAVAKIMDVSYILVAQRYTDDAGVLP